MSKEKQGQPFQAVDINQKARPLNDAEIRYVKDWQEKYLKVSKSSRSAELDRETGGDGFSVTGLLSVWFMERAYKFGFEKQLNEESAGKAKHETTDPRSTVTAVAVFIGVLLGALLGGALFWLFLSGPLGVAGAIVIGAAAGSVVGGGFGYIDSIFENGKLNDQISKAEIDVENISDKARDKTKAIELENTQGKQQQQIEALEFDVDNLKKTKVATPGAGDQRPGLNAVARRAEPPAGFEQTIKTGRVVETEPVR